MECSRLLTHVNDAITTHYDHSMMCNDAVTAPKWTSKIGQPSRTSQHVAVSKHMQEGDQATGNVDRYVSHARVSSLFKGLTAGAGIPLSTAFQCQSVLSEHSDCKEMSSHVCGRGKPWIKSNYLTKRADKPHPLKWTCELQLRGRTNVCMGFCTKCSI